MRKSIWALGLYLAAFLAVSANAAPEKILRVTMNDGSVKTFLVKQISKITVKGSDKDIVSSSSQSSSSSEQKVSSSSAEETSSSSSKQVASSSSKQNTSSSSSAKSSSSDSKSVSSSSNAKSSSSAKTESSSSTKAKSSSSTKTESSSSTKAKSSSSSKKSSAIVAVEKFNSKVVWDARLQQILLVADHSTNAQVSVFDIQGVRLFQLNVPVTQGVNSLPISSMNLASGKYVLHVDIDGIHGHKIVSVRNEGK